MELYKDEIRRKQKGRGFELDEYVPCIYEYNIMYYCTVIIYYIYEMRVGICTGTYTVGNVKTSPRDTLFIQNENVKNSE